MTKAELKTQLKEVENSIYQMYNGAHEMKQLKRQRRQLLKKIKALTPELVQGCLYSLENFIDAIPQYTGKDYEKPKKQFMAENTRLHAEDEQMTKLTEMLHYVSGSEHVYNWFNKNSSPSNITRTELKEEKEDVKSNNIYDRMCAKTMTTYLTEFQVRLRYNQEPITVYREFTKNTTLSMSDVRSFM
jgi:uncharacterized protein YoxC